MCGGGHRALVVTASLSGLPARERDADGIEIYRLPSWPVMGGRFPVLKPLADADDLWAQGIDFAVIQTRMYTQSVWGCTAVVIDHHRLYAARHGPALVIDCGFPFYGVSGDVLLKTASVRRGWPELERLAHADNAVDWRRRLNVPTGAACGGSSHPPLQGSGRSTVSMSPGMSAERDAGPLYAEWASPRRFGMPHRDDPHGGRRLPNAVDPAGAERLHPRGQRPVAATGAGCLCYNDGSRNVCQRAKMSRLVGRLIGATRASGPEELTRGYPRV